MTSPHITRATGWKWGAGNPPSRDLDAKRQPYLAVSKEGRVVAGGKTRAELAYWEAAGYEVRSPEAAGRKRGAP